MFSRNFSCCFFFSLQLGSMLLFWTMNVCQLSRQQVTKMLNGMAREDGNGVGAGLWADLLCPHKESGWIQKW